MSLFGVRSASTFDTAVAPIHTWASSCASVNICADLVSAPLMKMIGASSSTSANPRNSSGSSVRLLLFKTTPLVITMMPASSARSINARSASVHVDALRWASRPKPRALRMARAVAMTSSPAFTEPTNGSRFEPWIRAVSRYHSCRCWQM